MSKQGVKRRRIDGGEQGMTLIEVLVILAVIAVAASVSVLAVGGGSGRSVQAEALRLSSRIQLAADRTMLDDEAIALVPQADGYRFVQWDTAKAKWRELGLAVLDEPYRLPKGMLLTASDRRSALPLGADSSGEGFTITMTAEGRSWAVEFDGMTARVKTQAAATL